MWIVDIRREAHLLCLFRRRFARLAPHSVLELLSQSQLVCDIKSQCVKSSPMRFIFGWIFVLCLGADAMRATLKENWQDKLICECKEVKSVKKCPNYVKKGSFPPSFPRFYHHQVTNNQNISVNYCCGFTSSDLKKRWWQKKGVPAAKDYCLWERRPFENNRCCHLTPIRGNMGELPVEIKSAIVYSMAHPDFVKATGKKPEDLTYDDYKLKSKVFFEWQDVIGIEASDGEFLTPEENEDLLTDFHKRFSPFGSGPFTLMCEEDLDELHSVNEWNECRMPEREDTCCCPENGVLQAGKHVCLKVNGAEKHRRWIQEAINEEIEGWPGYVSGWKFDFGYTAFATDAPDWMAETDPKTQGKILYKKLDQVSSKKCVGWTTKLVGKTGQKTGKEYCTKIEVKLACHAGKVLYETVPGSELMNWEYACKAGMKNSVSGDPDFSSKCKCQ